MDTIKYPHRRIIFPVRADMDSASQTLPDAARWLHRILPRMVTAIELANGKIGPNAILPYIRDRAYAWSAFADHIDRETARFAIQEMGFLIGAAETLYQQVAKAAPGTALRQVEGAEQLLCRLAKPAMHIPRDSLYTYAIFNYELFSFTGDLREVKFINALRHVTAHLRDAAGAIRPLVIGHVTGEEPSLDRLAQAIQYVRGAKQKMTALSDEIIPGMSTFFVDRLRHFHCDWGRIGGVHYGGPSGAQSAPWIQMDLLLLPPGTRSKRADAFRIAEMPAEEQYALLSDRTGPCLYDKCVGESSLPSAVTHSARELIRDWTAFNARHAALIKGWFLSREEFSLNSSGASRAPFGDAIGVFKRRLSHSSRLPGRVDQSNQRR